MKYIYFLIIPIMFIVGCSSSNSEQMNRDIKNLKQSLDSLKRRNHSFDTTLDSLKSEIDVKEQKLKSLQQQLDSLNKNLEEEGLK